MSCLIPPFLCYPFQVEAEDGVNVRFKKKTGAHYVGPNLNDLSLVFLGEILRILLAPRIDGCGRYFFWTKEIKPSVWKEMLIFVTCLCTTVVTVMRRRRKGQLFFCANVSHIHTMCLFSLFYTWNEWSSSGKSFLNYFSSFLQCWK